MEQNLGSKLLKDLARAHHLRKHGDSENGIKLLRNGLKDAKTLTESLFYKMCLACLSIKVKLVTEGLQTLDTCYADLVEILDEGQGIPISMEGVLIELLTLANILSVDFIKMHSIHKSCELRKELRHGFMKTLKRASLVADCLSDQMEILYQSGSSSFREIITYLLAIQKKVKNNNSSILLVFGVFALSTIVCMVKSPRPQEIQIAVDLTKENILTARMIKEHADVSILDTLIFEFSPSVLENQTSLIAALSSLLENTNDTLEFLKGIQKEDDSQKLDQIIQASLYIKLKDYQKSCFIGEHLCRCLQKERHEADSLLLNTAWNIVGVSYFQLGKPNLAVRAFEKAFLASLRNMAPLVNMITALNVIGQQRIKINCLQQMLLIHKREKHFMDLTRFDFQELFIVKFCHDILSKFNEPISSDKDRSPVLFCHSLDEEVILSELADSLCSQNRFKESSDVYLTLLRKLRNNPANDSKFKVGKEILSIYHKVTYTLLKEKNYSDGLTVCNYLLEFGDNIQTELENKSCGIIILDVDVINLLLRIEILWNLDQHNEAISIIKKLLNLLENEINDNEPQLKRRRVVGNSNIDKDAISGLCKCRMITTELKVLLFNNLGVMHVTNDDKKEALDAFKTAIKTTEGPTVNEVLLFNYCKLLMDLDLEQISRKNWIDQKGCSVDLMTLKRTLSQPYIFISNDAFLLS